ncbi:hypothetical protein GCM10023145_18840 [Angustibacter luteus]
MGCVVRGDDAATVLLDAVGRRTSPLVGSLSGPAGRRAVVVPALSQPAPVCADLVATLVDLLLDNGFADVVVGTAARTGDRDRGLGSVGDLAAAAGCTGRTAAGRDYQVVDLHEHMVPAAVPLSSVLAGHAVAAAWAEADVRILLCRSVTDVLDGFAGSLDALLLVAPGVPGAEPADVAADLLQHHPPTLVIADALVSSDGPDGRHVLRELGTQALVVSTDALRLDVTLAGLQGEDPAASRLVQRALTRQRPAVGRVVGDLTPFPGWVRAHPLVRDAARRATTTPDLARLLAAATGGPDRGAGGGDGSDAVLGAFRGLLTPLVAAADDPMARGVLVGLLGAVSAVAQQVDGWTTTSAKGRVRRVEVPLGFDPSHWEPASYDELPELLGELDALLAGVPDVPGAMRWCLLDRSIVFETTRVVEAPFADFVARVDVAQGISLMADYLGGRRVPVSADDSGRPVRQAERNVYLPQPNYLAHWGGLPIDVCKIELVQREQGRHALHWRTVDSLNGSATYDDGTLSFTDLGAGRTRLGVRGRQLFTLPAFWQAADLDRLPEVKDDLVEDAYRRFFSTTFDNLEACYEGREFRIGRDADDEGPLVTQTLQLLLELASQWLSQHQPGWTTVTATPAPVVDVHGFRHFRGGAEAVG